MSTSISTSAAASNNETMRPMLFNFTLLIRLGAGVAVAALLGCAQAPVAQWQGASVQASHRGVQAYLVGMGQVADIEFEHARRAVGSTANLEAVAHIELLQCAARIASLEPLVCTPSVDAAYMSQAQLVYLNYLNAMLPVEAKAALLPAAQRKVVLALRNGVSMEAVVRDMQTSNDQPLSTLLACAIANQHQAAPLAVVGQAVDIASAQGWRKPLLAWLSVQRNLALEQGNTSLSAEAQQRIDLLVLTAAAR
jgi:hypothetical protein